MISCLVSAGETVMVAACVVVTPASVERAASAAVLKIFFINISLLYCKINFLGLFCANGIEKKA